MEYIGALNDPRSDEEKLKNYEHKELGMAFPIVWREKAQSEWRKFSIRNQDGSSSCGGQAGAKGLETLLGKAISAHPIYRKRSNYPAEGMWAQDIGHVLKNYGTTTEELSPSQNIGETEMNKDITVPTPLKIAGYAFPNVKDIDEIAQAIEARGHVVLLLHANLEEWTDFPIYNGKQFNMGHFVCGVDYFMYNNQKCILVEDSWGKFYGLNGQRIISEEYLYKRFDEAMYFIKESPIPDPIKPKHEFKKILTHGMMRDSDVKALQDILKFEGLFLKTVESTGNYLQLTAKSVLEWQKKHKVASISELNYLGGRRCGIKTIAKLNSLYN